MIAWAARYFGSIPPVFIDGLLYCMIALFVFCQSYFSGDEAAKYIAPNIKFWLNAALGSLAACISALKMFRSSTYAEHQQKKKDDEQTQFLRRTETKTP